MGKNKKEAETNQDCAKLEQDCLVEIIEIPFVDIFKDDNSALLSLIMQHFDGYDKVISDNDGQQITFDDKKKDGKSIKKVLEEKKIGGSIVCKFYRQKVNLSIPWGIARTDSTKGINGVVDVELNLVKCIERKIYDEYFVTLYDGKVKFLLQHYNEVYKKDGVAEFLRNEFVATFKETIQDCLKNNSDSTTGEIAKALQKVASDKKPLKEYILGDIKVTVEGFSEKNSNNEKTN